MHNEFTAISERDGEWHIAYCPEIPGANGQGRTKDEARQSLADAVALLLGDRREEGLRGVPGSQDLLRQIRASVPGCEFAGAFGQDAAGAQARVRAAVDVAVSAAAAPVMLDDVERGHILEVLRQVNGNRSAAAARLGISRRALYRRLERHGIAKQTSR